jgi:hypothetical protein
MSESIEDGPMVTTTFKTNWEKDVIPRFNTQNINGPLDFKIDAVIRMNAKNKLPSYCPKDGLYYDSYRVKRTGSIASTWDSRYNGIERLINENAKKLNEIKNLTAENRSFINDFLRDLRERGLPRIILDFNFGDPMTDLAICLRYNIRAQFNPINTDYGTFIKYTGVEGEPGSKADPSGSKTYTALVGFSAQSFKNSDTLMSAVEISIENGQMIEVIGGTTKDEYTVAGDMTLTPSVLADWNSSDKTTARIIGAVNVKSYEADNSTRLFDISNPSSPIRYIMVKWRPNGSSIVVIKSRINLGYNGLLIKPENPLKSANNYASKNVGLLGTDYSTVVLRTGVENIEKPDATKVYDAIAEYGISVAGTEKVTTNPDIRINIQNGFITEWDGVTQPEATKEISGKLELSAGTLEGWYNNPARKAYPIVQAGKYINWIYSAINDGRSDLTLLENYIKPSRNICMLQKEGKEQYFQVEKGTIENIYKRYVLFKWRPAAENADVTITTQISKDIATPESDTTNNQFAADVNSKPEEIETDTWQPGKILFDPNTTNGWSNKDVEVKVDIESGRETVTLSGTDYREYWERVLNCSKTAHTHSDACQPDCGIEEHSHSDSCLHKYVVRSPGAACGYTQEWKASTIKVEGDKYPFTDRSVANKGSVILSSDGIGTLKAQVTAWNPSMKSWNSNASPPSGNSATWYDPNNSNVNPDAPKDTENPLVFSNASTDYKYDSTSGIYKIDKTKPYEVEYLWDDQSIRGNRKDQDGTVCREYICSPDDNLTVMMGDNLSGIEEARYLWTENKNVPAPDKMLPVYGFETTEGKDEKKSFTIDINEYKKDYAALRKGLWYLHIFQKDRAGNERTTCSEPVYINKVENLKINTIYDFGWKKYFRKNDNTPTKLSQDGIGVEDMPVYRNKEGLGIKMGYNLDLSLDTIGFDKSDSKINVKALFYGLDSTNTLTPVDVYAWNKDGKLVGISDPKSEYYSKSKLLTLNINSVITPDISKSGYNTWSFSYFIPYNARIVKKGSSTPELKYESRFNKLLIVFDITGYKEYGTITRSIEFSRLETGWSQGNGSIYGENYPVDSDLLTEEPPYNDQLKYHGQIFWYDLKSSVMDDISRGRKW